jgi:1-acyl-sn-glycerol-3-phosphate acyltransferase
LTTTWISEDGEPIDKKISLFGWLLLFSRGGMIIFVITISLFLKLSLRLFEKPLFGNKRPITPYITVLVSRISLWLLSIPVKRFGSPLEKAGALVANHSSWLDIFALNSSQRLYFVSKSEVAKWPGIGLLAKATGTLFIRREAKEATVQKKLFEKRMKMGHRLLFFPEGTSTDGMRVLPFKSALFQAFFDLDLNLECFIQPVTVTYFAPVNEDPRFYGWWGDMSFTFHLLKTIASRRQGSIEIRYHDPLLVSNFAKRKELAAAAEKIIRSSHVFAVATPKNRVAD